MNRTHASKPATRMQLYAQATQSWELKIMFEKIWGVENYVKKCWELKLANQSYRLVVRMDM
jgi:hypothetical protein